MREGGDLPAHRDRLRQLHDQIRQQGPFVAHATRTLIEAVKL